MHALNTQTHASPAPARCDPSDRGWPGRAITFNNTRESSIDIDLPATDATPFKNAITCARRPFHNIFTDAVTSERKMIATSAHVRKKASSDS
jgi:hypothetical protein